MVGAAPTSRASPQLRRATAVIPWANERAHYPRNVPWATMRPMHSTRPCLQLHALSLALLTLVTLPACGGTGSEQVSIGPGASGSGSGTGSASTGGGGGGGDGGAGAGG